MVQIRATCIAFSILFLSLCVCVRVCAHVCIQSVEEGLEVRLELPTFTLLRGSFVLANAVCVATASVGEAAILQAFQ